MVCLANSRKHGGRCVAGLTWSQHDRGRWIRPVTPFGGGELSWEHFYRNEGEPQPLDIVQLAVVNPRPVGFHVEDYVIDTDTTWTQVGVVAFSQLAGYVEPPSGALWVNAGSTAGGMNDRIPTEHTVGLSQSLKLVRPERLTVCATSEGPDKNRRRVRGSFAYGTSKYILPVTDPAIESRFALLPPGTTRTIKNPLLCLSVSELFAKRNEHYKLIAAVIEPN